LYRVFFFFFFMVSHEAHVVGVRKTKLAMTQAV
jgi:hypothetical protein